MPYIEEKTVEAMSVKEIANPTPRDKEYGSTHKCSIKIEDDWYVLGNIKSGNRPVKVSDGFIDKGAVVSFSYVNSPCKGFRNIKRPTLEVDVSPPPPPTKPTVKQGSKSGYVNPSEVGQCMNLAVSLGLVGNYDQFLDPKNVEKSIALYKKARDLFNSKYLEVQPLEGSNKEGKIQSTQGDWPF